MTVMCVISRAFCTTRHCRCGYLLYLTNEAPLAAGSAMALPLCTHNLLSLVRNYGKTWVHLVQHPKPIICV